MYFNDLVIKPVFMKNPINIEILYIDVIKSMIIHDYMSLI